LLAVALITGVVEIVPDFVDQTVVLDITDNADDFCTAGAIVVAVDAFT
jgi:hypothetical protein